MGSTKVISIFSNSDLIKVAERRAEDIRAVASANTATKISQFDRQRLVTKNESIAAAASALKLKR